MAKKRKIPESEPVSPLMLNKKAWDKDKVVSHICKRISSSNKSISSILADGLDGLELPDYTTFHAWIAEDKEISHRYASAKSDQADFLAEEMIEIADNGTNDTYKDDNGNVRTEMDVIARSRLRIDTRKWLASKLKPKKYGERMEAAITGADGGAIKIESLSDTEIARQIYMALAIGASKIPDEVGNGEVKTE